MTAIVWRATVLTLFPEMFPGPLGISLAGKALAIRTVGAGSPGYPGLGHRPPPQRRRHAGRRRSRDGAARRRAGGGDRCGGRFRGSASPADEPAGSAIDPGPVAELAAGPGPLIVCGRFEGVDQRVIGARRLEEVSIGDYVLSGGEIAAMALIDACVRLLPGVMGKLASGADESFSDGLLEYPQYTRPQDLRGHADPGAPAVRRPRQGCGLAPGRGRSPDPRAAARPLGCQRRPKSPKKHDRRVTTAGLCRIAAPNPRNGRIDGRLRSRARQAGARRRWRFSR